MPTPDPIKIADPINSGDPVQNVTAPATEPVTEPVTEVATENATAKKPRQARKKQKAPKKKRPPQLNTNGHIRGMLAALQADYPGTTYTELVEDALRRRCNQVAALPPIHLARLDEETLRRQAGIAAETETTCNRIIRAIIKAKTNREVQAKLTDELEDELEKIGALRRTMMRQAAIPMVPNLPEDVSLGIEALIAVLEHEKLECPHSPTQTGYQTCIQILKAYRPIEYDLPEDLRDPLAGDDSE